jgi:hypothetical protein
MKPNAEKGIEPQFPSSVEGDGFEMNRLETALASGKLESNFRSWYVSGAARPFGLFVRRPVSAVRRVIFWKGAHNGRPF